MSQTTQTEQIITALDDAIQQVWNAQKLLANNAIYNAQLGQNLTDARLAISNAAEEISRKALVMA